MDAASIAAILDEFADRVVMRVAQLLAEPQGTSNLLTAADVAGEFGMSVAWVYAHQDDLGVQRLGAGTKPRLRFRRELVDQYLHRRLDRAREISRSRIPLRPTSSVTTTAVELLPIRGRPQ